MIQDPETIIANAPEVIVTDEHHVACDGGSPALGHPVTWYEMGKDDFVRCKYCDRVFVKRHGRHDPSMAHPS